MSMRTADYDFHLPEELIAHHPAPERDGSRLLCIRRRDRSISHHTFRDLPHLLPPHSLQIFRNDATVMRARIRASRPSGGAVECVLLEPDDGDERMWQCLLKPGKKLPVGACFGLEGHFLAEVLAKDLESGVCRVRFEVDERYADIIALSDACGELPLPPYIERAGPEIGDDSRYQTVYADPAKKVAAAAPTAGLHFTPAIEAALRADGHTFHAITLRVGLGTFRPVKVDRVADHPIHRERYWIPQPSVQALHEFAGRRLAIGTTSVRAIEDCLAHQVPGAMEAFSRDADLFIIPPARFSGVDHLVTNFHLPRSTLFGLVAAFLTPGSIEGVGWLKEIYAEAVAHRYRFFSYGDAMLIL